MDLPEELRAQILASKGTHPIIHHLNADSSWLLQIPYPSTSALPHGRKFFNLIIDPWLTGAQSDVASWFSKQTHAHEPWYGSIREVEELCWRVEKVFTGGEGHREGRVIDAVAISHEFTDHCHEETMRMLMPDTAVFANDKAIDLIKSWKHFNKASIYDIPAYTSNWLSLSTPPLPSHISISRLQTGDDFLYYHSAIIIAFQPASTASSTEEAGQAIIYTPHGLPVTSQPPFVNASPPLRTLALLHGLHDVKIPWTGPFNRGTQQLNLGAHNALKLQRQIKAKYWFCTHDEVKHGGGLVGCILRRKVISLEDALKEEAKGDTEAEDVEVVDLGNGKGMVLT